MDQVKFFQGRRLNDLAENIRRRFDGLLERRRQDSGINYVRHPVTNILIFDPATILITVSNHLAGWLVHPLEAILHHRRLPLGQPL
jgi:hypothetical protein